MKRIYNHKQFINRVKELVGDAYIFTGVYVRSSEHMTVIHNACGYSYSVTPNVFLRGRRCPKCFEKRRGKSRNKGNEKYIHEVFEQVGNEYTVLSEYINDRTPITLIHHTCGNQITMQAGSFIRGTRCKKCSFKILGEKNRKTHDDFVLEVKSLVGNEYTVVGQYEMNKSKIEIRHNTCDQTWFPTANNFLRGSRCDHCFGKHTKTTEKFKCEVFELVGNEYSVLGEYEKSLKGIEMIHNDCGYIWNPRPNDFLSNGSRCPICSNLGESKGVQRIIQFFEASGIDYKREVRFKDCRNIKPLPFDFMLKVNGDILLVEYDGQQHFIANRAWGGEKTLRETQKRDKIKTNYCIANKIALIRIPYWDYDETEAILEKVLS